MIQNTSVSAGTLIEFKRRLRCIFIDGSHSYVDKHTVGIILDDEHFSEDSVTREWANIRVHIYVVMTHLGCLHIADEHFNVVETLDA